MTLEANTEKALNFLLSYEELKPFLSFILYSKYNENEQKMITTSLVKLSNFERKNFERIINGKIKNNK